MKYCLDCGEFVEDETLDVCPQDGGRLQPIPVQDEDERLQALVGTVVDERFEVSSFLGRGGMGAVYVATQLSVGREVALKLILGEASKDGIRRFMREAKTTSRLRNVHTITTYDFGVHADGELYLAMELLEGDALSDRLRRTGPLPWRTALHVVSQVAESLVEAHEQGVIHRDLKGDNIFLTKMGNDEWFVKVLDFGIAKVASATASTITKHGAVIGTPQYMAPEQAKGDPVDGRADLYSLGIVLYEMLAGRVPFSADTPMALLLSQISDPVPPVAAFNPGADVPEGVHQLLVDLLHKEPERRLESAEVLRARCEILASTGGHGAGLARAGEPALAQRSPGVALPGVATVTHNAAPAAAAPPLTPTAAPAVGFQTGAVAAVRPTPPPSRGPSPWALVAVGLVVAAAVVAALLLLTGKDGEPPSTPVAADRAVTSPPPAAAEAAAGDVTRAAAPPAVVKPKAPDAAPRPAEEVAPVTPSPAKAAVKTHFTLKCSAGSGTDVLDPRGEFVGHTPLDLPTPDKPLKLRLQRKGYESVEVDVAAGAVGERTVKLKRVRKKRPKKRPRGGGAVDELLDN